jgi:hypothetical protein
VETPPKPGIRTMPDAFIRAMLACIPALKSAGIKWVSGYADNYKRGQPLLAPKTLRCRLACALACLFRLPSKSTERPPT